MMNQQSVWRAVFSKIIVTSFASLLLFAFSATAFGQWTNGTNISNTNSGNVGIGTTTPNRKLELFGDVSGLSFEAFTGSPNSGAIRFGDNSGWKFHIGRSRNSIGGALNSGTSGVLMTIQDNGNVGIGTSAPGAGLDVINSVPAGTATARFKNLGANTQVIIDSVPSQNTNLRFDNNAAPAWVLGNEGASDNRFRVLNSNTNGNVELFTILQGGNIGVGTPAPAYKLDVRGTGYINAAGGLCIAGDCRSAWSQIGGSSQWTNGGSGAINYSGGNVGIGTSAPSSKLHVTGSANITGDLTVGGNLAAKYQDVAEWVDSSQRLEPGTVVVLDQNKSNQVIASTQTYDSRVAGVISVRPGLALGEAGVDRVLVATTGRVKIKVSAANGPINIGDLLVTSDEEGVAMKSLPINIGGVQIHRPGTLIGKALEPLAKGRGEILVLLSLQ